MGQQKKRISVRDRMGNPFGLLAVKKQDGTTLLDMGGGGYSYLLVLFLVVKLAFRIGG